MPPVYLHMHLLQNKSAEIQVLLSILFMGAPIISLLPAGSQRAVCAWKLGAHEIWK